MVESGRPVPRRRWRGYETAAGRSPVEEFIDGLSDDDAAAVLAGMREVRDRGLAPHVISRTTSGRSASMATG
jgi:hypothetical protein